MLIMCNELLSEISIGLRTDQLTLQFADALRQIIQYYNCSDTD